MRLILVRHAQATRNGRDDFGLTELGRRQAVALSQRLVASLGDRGITALYTSSARRARETAAILSDGLSSPVVVLPTLAEMGELPSREGFETETLAEFIDRVRSTILPLTELGPGERVLLVCHAGFIVGTMLALLSIPEGGVRARIEPRLASITEWHHDGAEWTLVSHNADIAEGSL